MSFLGLTAGDAALGAAGIQAGGSLLGGFFGSNAQSATNAQSFQNAEMLFNQQQQSIPAAQIQAELNNYAMRGSAWQATVDDMRKAGINPILAASVGPTQGAASPAMMASGANPSLVSPGAAMQAGVTNAAALGRTYADTKASLTMADKDASQVDLNKATQTLTNKQSEKTEQDTATSKSAETLNNAATAVKASEILLNGATAQNASAQARVNTRIAEDTERFGDSPISKAVGGFLRMLNTAGRNVPNSAAVLNGIGVTNPSTPAPPVYRRGPDGRPITDFWGRPK